MLRELMYRIFKEFRVREIFGRVILGVLLFSGSAGAQGVPKTVFSEWKAKVDPAVERGLQLSLIHI